MKPILPIALLAAVGLAGAAVAAPALAPQPAPQKPAEARADRPAATPAGDMWSRVHWDDDDSARRGQPWPRLNSAALRQAGMVKVREVERDDGEIEVEGYDARGREIDVTMDAAGQRVLRVDRDDEDDRWGD
ncbi:hypothetical protein [Phenylobacterium sp.]|uniref:hypothetical protein n=1 Tax=Phenylobacterium sp. TaxID=1871053 RepID=UPI003918717F